MIVYLVMVEQYYADNVRPDAIFSTREKAEEYCAERRLGDDLRIYEVEVDNTKKGIG